MNSQMEETNMQMDNGKKFQIKVYDSAFIGSRLFREMFKLGVEAKVNVESKLGIG